MVDIPGSYSLMAHSAEEEVARDFICFGDPDAVVVVCDATCLERNLNLVLQTIEITPRTVVCVNLMDEAEKKKIRVDIDELSRQLGVPVTGACARSGKGLDALMDAVDEITQKKDALADPVRVLYAPAVEEAVKTLELSLRECCGNALSPRWLALRLLEGEDDLIRSAQQYLDEDVLDRPDVQELLRKARKQLEEAALSAPVQASVHLDSASVGAVRLGMAFSMENALQYNLMLEGTADDPSPEAAARLLEEVYARMDTAGYGFSFYGVQLENDGASVTAAQVTPAQIKGGNLARIFQLALEGDTESGVYLVTRGPEKAQEESAGE